MDKLGYALGLVLCLEAAAFGHFEHRQSEQQAYPFHKNWSVRLAAYGNDLGPMTADSSAADESAEALSAEAGPCAGSGLALACAP